MLYRKAELGPIDVAARSVPVVLATDFPVQRDGFLEILDLGKVDLSRGDLPLIESHDADNLNIGVIRDIRVDGNKLRGVAVFGTSARASEILADVQAGIITGVSIGYQLIGDGEPTVINGQPARTFAFMPYEASAVAIPADPTAGFFRSRKTISLPQSFQGKSIMETVIETETPAAEIAAMGRAMSLPADLVLRAVEGKKSVNEFQRMALEFLSRKPLPTSDIGTMNERKHDVPPVLRTAADFDAHYSTRGDFRSGAGLTLADFLRGTARMKTSELATRALSIGTDTSGGFAVPSVLMPNILAALVPTSSLLQAGAGISPLADGAKTYTSAAINAIPTAAWRAEAGALATSDPTFRSIVATPRSLSFQFKVSRELLSDGQNLEAALNIAIAQAFAKELDRAGLRGSGSAPEPRGVLNTVGIQSVTNGANGLALGNYANIFSAFSAILGADGPAPTAAIMSPRSLIKLGGLLDTTGQPVLVPPMLGKMQLIATSQIPNNLTVGTSTDCSEIYVGDFTNLSFAMRENVSIQLLQELYAGTGELGFACHMRVDVVCSYPAALAVVTGVRA